jgi:hypothetical protein
MTGLQNNGDTGACMVLTVIVEEPHQNPGI